MPTERYIRGLAPLAKPLRVRTPNGGVEESVIVLSMVIDGMDKSKFKVPRNLDTKVGSNQLWDECWRPTCPMTGVLAHGVAEHYSSWTTT